MTNPDNTEKQIRAERTFSLLLAELDYCRMGISKAQEHIGRSFVVFYIPILVALGYALTFGLRSTRIILFVIPFALCAYLGYIAYLVLMQRGFEVYRCSLEHDIEDYVDDNVVIHYQRNYVKELYYEFTKWHYIPLIVTRNFAFGTLLILTGIIIIPSVAGGWKYFGERYPNHPSWPYLWLIAFAIVSLSELFALFILVSKPHLIWGNAFSKK